jgi:hypothetical protein
MITFVSKPLLEGRQHPLTVAEAHSLRLEDKVAFSRSLGELLQVVQTDISRGIQLEGASLPVSCEQLTRAILLAAAGRFRLLSEAGITLTEDCLGIVDQLIYLNRSDMFHNIRMDSQYWPMDETGQSMSKTVFCCQLIRQLRGPGGRYAVHQMVFAWNWEHFPFEGNQYRCREPSVVDFSRPSMLCKETPGAFRPLPALYHFSSGRNIYMQPPTGRGDIATICFGIEITRNYSRSLPF